MQRPIMNPNFLDVGKPHPKRSLLDRLRPIGRVLRLVGRILLYDPLKTCRGQHLKIEDGTPWQRFCRGLLYRLTFVPIFAALAVGALVYSGTHPKQAGNELDPNSLGVYYDPVTLRTEDGLRIEAWLVPAYEAGQILKDKEYILKQKQPAILLVHDYGRDRAQMLPLIRPLHDAGFVVMVVALRGCGASTPAGSTFGLLESNDVKAAIATLRRRSYVDPGRIAVVGVGTGANAVLLAAADDPMLKVMVLDHPAHGGGAILADRVGPHHPAFNWMRPMCKWTFELFYQVDANDLNLTRFTSVMSSRKVMMIDENRRIADFGPKSAKNICRFLSAGLTPETATAVNSMQ